MQQKEKDVFVYRQFDELPEYEKSEHVFVYTMTSYDGRVALVLLNFSNKEQKVELKEYSNSRWTRLLERNIETIESGRIQLGAYEGVVYADW